MVVLCGAVCTKAGKVLVSRQFVLMTRIRIEGLLAAFPKLMSSDSQHTFVETDDVRYLYQPLDQLYVMMVTTKQSNIMEDLETLRLLAKLVPEFCGGQTEENVLKNVFQVIFAFDEIICCGYKENVQLQQIKTFMEMDSHEEKLQKIILDSKMNDARETARKQADMIDRKKADDKRMDNLKQWMQPPRDSGFEASTSVTVTTLPTSPEPVKEKPMTFSKPVSKPIRGMQLGKTKTTDFAAQISKEEPITVAPSMPSGTAAAGHAAPVEAKAMDGTVNIITEEKLVLQVERDGAVKTMDLKGEMKLTIFDPDSARIVVKTTSLPKTARVLLHPKINKNAFSKDNAITLSDPSKNFPVGSDNAPVVVKYRLQFKDDDSESKMPLSLNFWPSVEDGRSVVSVELERGQAGIDLYNVSVHIPCQSSEAPDVSKVDGDYGYNKNNKVLVWSVGEITESKPSASMEFSIPETDADNFYPINIGFTSSQTYAGLSVTGVEHAETNAAVPYRAQSVLSVEQYQII